MARAPWRAKRAPPEPCCAQLVCRHSGTLDHPLARSHIQKGDRSVRLRHSTAAALDVMPIDLLLARTGEVDPNRGYGRLQRSLVGQPPSFD
jgi:hypothetical protein